MINENGDLIMDREEIDVISWKFRSLPKCSRCNGPMVTNPDYEEPYCGSWEYMEGGCKPAPIFIEDNYDK